MRSKQDRRHGKPPRTKSIPFLVYQPRLPLASVSGICFGKICLKEVVAMNNNHNNDVKYIYVAFITRNGKRIYARQYGRKAFRIAVKR